MTLSISILTRQLCTEFRRLLPMTAPCGNSSAFLKCNSFRRRKSQVLLLLLLLDVMQLLQFSALLTLHSRQHFLYEVVERWELRQREVRLDHHRQQLRQHPRSQQLLRDPELLVRESDAVDACSRKSGALRADGSLKMRELYLATCHLAEPLLRSVSTVKVIVWDLRICERNSFVRKTFYSRPTFT